LWSLHPKYLDRLGLIALWREALLAQKVLKLETKGYRHHPQLIRFKGHCDPEGAITTYLLEVWEESQRRGYTFDRGKIIDRAKVEKIPVTGAQLNYEFEWLCCKLKVRNNDKYEELRYAKEIECHPLFEVVEGEIEAWEKLTRVKSP